MLCEKCGTQNEEGRTACANCGAALADGKEKPKKKGRLGTLILILIAALALYVAVVGSGVLGGGAGTPQEAAEKTIEVIFAGDTKALINQFPSKLIKAVLEEGGYKNKEELAEDLGSELEGIAALRKESGVRFTVNAVGKSSDGLDYDACERAKSLYGELGLEVTSYTYVNVEVTATLGEMRETRSIYVPVARIDGSWYVDFEEFSMGNVYSALY